MFDKMYARLKPYNKLKNHVRIDYRAPWGMVYKSGEWHEFDMQDDSDVAAIEYLKTVLQHVADQYSPPAFDICNREQAKNLIIAEKKSSVETVVPMREPPKAPTQIKATVSRSLNKEQATHELELDEPSPPSKPMSKIEQELVADVPEPTLAKPKRVGRPKKTTRGRRSKSE
jgi:hypothetical protein